MSFYTNQPLDAASFRIFSQSMLQSESLPLSQVIDEELFKKAFELFEVEFAHDEEAVYTPSLVLWALISQALFKDEHRSLTAAVTRIASWWASQGRVVSDTNTGAYSRARHKIPDQLVAWLVREIAQRSESTSDLVDPIDDEEADSLVMPTTLAEVRSRSIGGRVLLVDGFTVDAADTPDNQEAYPQNPAQKEGLGFPILRCVSLA